MLINCLDVHMNCADALYHLWHEFFGEGKATSGRGHLPSTPTPDEQTQGQDKWEHMSGSLPDSRELQVLELNTADHTTGMNVN